MVWEELRSAVRFPVHLPVLVLMEGAEVEALTKNISHNGVLLETPCSIREGTRLEFLLQVPPDVMMNGSTAAIHCAGHVVRAYEENGIHFAAAVIDEYRFQ